MCVCARARARVSHMHTAKSSYSNHQFLSYSTMFITVHNSPTLFPDHNQTDQFQMLQSLSLQRT